MDNFLLEGEYERRKECIFLEGEYERREECIFLEEEYERREDYIRMLSNVISFLKKTPKDLPNGWLLHSYYSSGRLIIRPFMPYPIEFQKSQISPSPNKYSEHPTFQKEPESSIISPEFSIIDSTYLTSNSSSMDLDFSSVDLDFSSVDLDFSIVDLDSSNMDRDSSNTDRDSSNTERDSSNTDRDSTNTDLDSSNMDLDSSNMDLDSSNMDLDSDPSFMDLQSSITESGSSISDHESSGIKSLFHSPKIKPGKLFVLPQINQNILPLPQINTECSTNEKKKYRQAVLRFDQPPDLDPSEEIDDFITAELVDNENEGEQQIDENLDVIVQPDARVIFTESLQDKLSQESPIFYSKYRELIAYLIHNNLWTDLSSPYIKGQISAFARHYKIPRTTLQYWRKKLKEDPNFQPDHKKGSNSRVFTDEQETFLYNLVINICRKLHLPMTNSLFREIAMKYYDELPPGEHPQPGIKFKCSDHFILKFKKRHQLSIRKSHPKRRPDVSQEEINSFRSQGKRLFNLVADDHIINCDESFWNLIYLPPHTWAPCNSDNIIISPKENEKKGFTVLASIRKDGQKLPLLLIARGKTLVAERNWFGEGHHILEPNTSEPVSNPLYEVHYLGLERQPTFIPDALTDHSPKGWMNRDVMFHYLDWLREMIPPLEGTHLFDWENTIILFADAYKVHHLPEIDQHAWSLNIIIIKIPEGTTDQCQPLDCRVFGILKNQAKAYYNARVAEFIMRNYDSIITGQEIHDIHNDLPEIKIEESARLLQALWKDLPEKDIQEAWKKAFEINEGDNDVQWEIPRLNE